MTVPNNCKPGIRTPIIVMRRMEPDEDEKRIDVVCGLGRIEAATVSGEPTIRAIVADDSREESVQFEHMESAHERTTD